MPLRRLPRPRRNKFELVHTVRWKFGAEFCAVARDPTRGHRTVAPIEMHSRCGEYKPDDHSRTRCAASEGLAKNLSNRALRAGLSESAAASGGHDSLGAIDR